MDTKAKDTVEDVKKDEPDKIPKESGRDEKKAESTEASKEKSETNPLDDDGALHGAFLVTDFQSAQRYRAHKNSVNALAFTSKGDLLASGGSDDTVRLWSIPKVALVNTLQGHSSTVSSIAISPDGVLLASGSYDRTVRLWSLPKGELTYNLVEVDSIMGVTAVAFFPGTRFLAVGIYWAVRVWDMSNGEQKHVLQGESRRVFAIAVSPDGTRLASSGSSDGTVHLWSMPKGELAGKLEGHAASVKAVAFSPDGNLLVTGSHKTVRVWGIPKGEKKHFLQEHSDMVNAVAVSPDGTWLASGSSDRKVCLWSMSKGELARKLEGHAAAVNAVAFSPNGKLLASADANGMILIWELGQKQRCWALFDPALFEEQVDMWKCRHTTQVLGGTVCTCDLVCTCNSVWLPVTGGFLPSGQVCVCNMIKVGPSKSVVQSLNSVGQREAKNTRQVVGGACTCDQVCTCNAICTCDLVSTPTPTPTPSPPVGPSDGGRTYHGSHYWRPN
jgi:WD40 repeat protein